MRVMIVGIILQTVTLCQSLAKQFPHVTLQASPAGGCSPFTPGEGFSDLGNLQKVLQLKKKKKR